jgi:uncharacterized membrane protein
MKTWMLKFRDMVRVNFWLVPSMMVAAAVVLSFAMIELDVRVDGHALLTRMGWKFTSGTDGARQVLATVASSMITITSITFSLTIVALQLASSQFGPRLLRNFMADRGTQVVLGTFIATFTYSLLILRSIHTEDDVRFVPHLSILLAVIFALGALGVLIFYIHHTATTIQAEHVINNVTAELKASLVNLFPESMGNLADPGQELAKHHYSTNEAAIIRSQRSNYLQAIDTQRLMEIATEHDLVLQLVQRPGRFLLQEVAVAYVWPREKVDQSMCQKIRETFLLGSVRSPLQDAEFAVDQLVEIAVRALSKGINDPYTAISCVDRLAEALQLLSERCEPSKYRADQHGKLRIISEIESFAGIVNASFDQIRQAARDVPAVLTRMLDRIVDLAAIQPPDSLRHSLRQQVTMIGNSSRQAIEPGKDLQDIERRCQLATRLLDGHHSSC